MSDRRPRAGDLLAAAGAVGLAGALSLNWFAPGRGGAIVSNPVQPSTTGWVALGWCALALLIGAMIASLLQLGSVVLAAGAARALAAVTGAAGVAAAVTIVVRLIVAPDLDAVGLVEVSRRAALATGGVAAVTAVMVVARLVDRPDLGQGLTSYATVVRWPALVALACALLVVAGAGLAARAAPG